MNSRYQITQPEIITFREKFKKAKLKVLPSGEDLGRDDHERLERKTGFPSTALRTGFSPYISTLNLI